ncbi:MAG: hypothetical protein OEV44_05015 [Spirochaetota bacterium]|nr:hypothetical protein [Spirochaetota bacterium]
MKYFIILTILISSLTFAKNENANTNEDIYLTDRAFEKKYINKLKSIKYLSLAYYESKDLHEKMFLIKRLTDFLNDNDAFNTVIDAVNEELPEKGNGDLYWKIRASAIYLLGEKAINLPNNKKIIILQNLVNRFKTDKKYLVIAASAFTLVKLATDNPNTKSDHRLLNKRTIANLFSDRILNLNHHENYLCWALSKASMRLGDPLTRYALIEARKKPFNRRVLSEIQKSINFLSKIK